MKKAVNMIIATTIYMGYTWAQINVKVPMSRHNNQEEVADAAINVSWSSDIRIYLVQLANKYLRIALVVALLVIVVITGAKLMSWNDEKSWQTLTNALIGILIAVFSYAIIKMIVTLF